MIAMLAELRIPGQPDPVREILEVFAVDGERGLSILGEAFASNDSDGLRRAAHRLKGAAANVGAVELATLLARVEDGARGGHLEVLDGDLRRAAHLFRDSLTALEALA